MTDQHLVSYSAALVSRGLTRLSHRLFEPPRTITGVTERRQGRLLAQLQLAHAFSLFIGVALTRRAETGRVGELLPKLLFGQAVCILACYALSRTRHTRIAVWAHASMTLAFPTLALTLTQPTTGLLPLMGTVMLFPPVLLVNALVSARAALVTGLLALVPIWTAYYLFGNPYWPELLRGGTAVFLVFMLLAVIFGVYRDGIEADRMAELQARNQELEELRRTLDDKVETRTRELSERNTAMLLVLDNVAQGIFTVVRSGAMPAEHSAVLRKWFGPVEVGEPFFRYLGRSSAHFADACELGWEQLVQDIIPPEVSLAQLPSSLQAGQRSYRLSYEQIADDQEGRILIVVSDVTAEVERERAELDKKETFTVFEHVLGNRRGFAEFMREASGFVDRLSDATTSRSDMLRALHTLKGNCMLFGFQGVARMCHQLESHMAGGAPVDDGALGALVARWRRLSADMDRLLGHQRNVIEFSLEQHAALKRAARAHGAKAELVRVIDDLAFEPVERRLSHLVDHAQRLADRFGKRVQVDILHGDIHLDERPWPLLWAALVHAVRNAIDHGIESAAERRAAGKDEVGRLVLRARREAEDLILEIEDDGRGLDWQAIARKCKSMNLPSASRGELLDALFADGMSTAEEITDISGRGMGMGALRSAVRALAGELFVESEPGRGTLLRMPFAPTGWQTTSAMALSNLEPVLSQPSMSH